MSEGGWVAGKQGERRTEGRAHRTEHVRYVVPPQVRATTRGARVLQPWQTPPLAHSCDCLRCRGDLAARGVCVGRSQQATAIGWKESVAGDSGPREGGNSKATQKASTPFPVGGRCSMAALVEAPQARLRYLRQWGHGDRGPRLWDCTGLLKMVWAFVGSAWMTWGLGGGG
jgi:hypothetical protein